MAVKTFTTGEVLTASDTNTYLNNGGLVYVSSGSFSGALSFDITGLTDTYIYYRAMFSGVGASTPNMNATLYQSTTARNSQYYAGVGYAAYDNTTGGANSSNNAASFYTGQFSTSYRAQTIIDFRRKTSEQFTFTLQAFEGNTFRAIHSAGFRNATDSFDRIRITPSTSTVTGEWRLFGYREP